MFNFNGYQQSVYLSSANRVSSAIYGLRSGITGYFGLRKVNAELEAENAFLQNQVFELSQQVKTYKSLAGNNEYPYISNDRYSYTIASVLNNDVRHKQNYFIIDKGHLDGVKPGLGVVNHLGVVGIVDIVGEHTSRVISVLNEKQRFSVKIKGTDYVGSLLWKLGNSDIAYIDELPRHMKYRLGDTIVTSGFSTTFPSGLPVGTILSRIHGDNDNYINLKIKLFPDFAKLETVRIINHFLKEEIDSLQPDHTALKDY